jgi:6-phosphogluconolactonase
MTPSGSLIGGTMTVALYAAVGADITRYAVDVERAELHRGETVSVAQNVQYAWPHVSGRFLYVASSDNASGLGPVGRNHAVTAFAIDPATGALTRHGAPIPLPQRPIHIATDMPSRHILAAFSNPGAFHIYRINQDGTLGEAVLQPAPIDPGIYPHQVRATPDGTRVILVSRGHNPAGGKPEEPGALQVFDYVDGVLGRQVSVAPDGGYGFGPRHLDFHPNGTWIYVSLERQNALAMMRLEAGAVAPALLFTRPTLADPAVGHPRQLAGTVHVHPNGRLVYAVNRASATTTIAGRAVFAGGENTLVVYAIDPGTGEPTAIQTSTPAASIAARSTSIAPAACWSRPTSWAWRYATARRSEPNRPGCRCSASPPTDDWRSSAAIRSMLATGRCSGWAWRGRRGLGQPKTANNVQSAGDLGD